ncbi:MAG: AMP-binding protein [Pseudomonadota bacterium]|nr:AMP-binding protein [Pseudomonadota bacterium]
MRVIDLFDRGAMLAPDAPCLRDDAREITYREARAATHAIARALRALGVGVDDRVAVITPNDAWGYVACLAIGRAEAVWVPLNPRNSFDDNLGNLDLTAPKLLLYHSDHADEAARWLAGCDALEAAVCIDRDDAGRPGLPGLIEGDDGSPVPPPAERTDRGALYRLNFTGGTTGRPKAVPHKYLAHEINAAAYAILWGGGAPPRYLLAAPMTHAAGGLAPAVMMQGGLVRLIRKADPERIMELIEAERITELMLPPTVIYAMLDHPRARDFDYSSLRHFMFAAAPMSPEKIRRAMDIFGPCFAQFYAQSEVAMSITWMGPRDYADAAADPALSHRLASAGRPGPFTQLAIMDPDGRLLGEDEVGEVVVRSNQVFDGYHENPTATAEAFAHGWHHTGDLGRRDADGYYYLVDRKRDMVISGGFNIYPGEVERVLLAHPAIQDCAVIGTPDDRWGEALTAVVQLSPGASLDAETLRAWARERLSGVNTPKRYEFWEDLPRSPVGKVLKRVIRDRFWDGRERAI